MDQRKCSSTPRARRPAARLQQKHRSHRSCRHRRSTDDESTSGSSDDDAEHLEKLFERKLEQFKANTDARAAALEAEIEKLKSLSSDGPEQAPEGNRPRKRLAQMKLLERSAEETTEWNRVVVSSILNLRSTPNSSKCLRNSALPGVSCMVYAELRQQRTCLRPMHQTKIPTLLYQTYPARSTTRQTSMYASRPQKLHGRRSKR